MEEWARLVDKYASELKKFDMVCAFCGQHMSDLTVNTDCVENNSMFDSYTYYTDEEPPQHIIHKARHWFGRPSMRQFNQLQQHNPGQQMIAANNIDARCDQFLQDNQQFNSLFKKLN